MTNLKHITGLAAALALTPAVFAGNTLEVPGPLKLSIQEAIDIAESLGATQLNIADGTYAESVQLPANGYDLVLMGNPANPAAVVIDATGLDDSVVHVLDGQTAATQLVGLTLTGGDATGAAPDERGGGLYINNSSPTVISCVFENNVAIVGGGVYCNAGSPSFTDCEVRLNVANLGGGAYFNNSSIDVTGGTFHQNDAVAGQGGAIRALGGSLTITGTTFTDNTATVERCRFIDNVSGNGAGSGRGGAIAAVGTTIRNSIFVGNHAEQYGGAVHATNAAAPLTVHNCSFSANTAGVDNSVIAGNTAPSVVSCIAWGNGGATPINASAIVSYSNIEVSDPLFVNAASVDLHLQPGSPAIDAGDTTVVVGQYPVDLDGELRAVNDPSTPDAGVPFMNLAVDMGAYELQPELVVSCPSDISGDGMVGIDDFLTLLAAWGPCP
jgi:hypothetical protein